MTDWFSDLAYQFLTDDDIIQQVTNLKVSTENESDNDSDSEDGSNDVPTNGEAMEMLDKCLKLYECQSTSHQVQLYY